MLNPMDIAKKNIQGFKRSKFKNETAKNKLQKGFQTDHSFFCSFIPSLNAEISNLANIFQHDSNYKCYQKSFV